MLLAVGSWRGSPGATTAVLALAEAWPTKQKVFVAECDPRGGTLVTRFLIPGPRRLAELAGQARHGGSLDLLDQHAVEVASGAKVLTGPEDGRLLRAALKALLVPGGVFERAADDPDTVLIADVGRVDPEVPEMASLLLLADVLVLVARPVAEQILPMSGAGEQVRALHPDAGLLLVGPGYPVEHVAELLRMPVFGALPLAPSGAAAVRERLTRRNRFAEAAERTCRALAVRETSGIPDQRMTASDLESASLSEGFTA